MKQGEIWNANLSPTQGSEQAGFQPVVIISGDLMNKYLKVVICCPLTTKVKHYKGNVVLDPTPFNRLRAQSEILIFHVRSLSKEHLVEKMGTITKEELAEAMKGLNEILTY